MDWQFAADTVPSSFVTEAQARSLLGKPPATGAWRDGDPVGNRRFLDVGPLHFESGGSLDAVRIAYESWGELSPAGDNAVLVLHALTGDSHLSGPSGDGHATSGWWGGIVGPGLAIDTDRWFVVAPNMLGGCQGSTGPASLSPDGSEWGARFPHLTIRDQVAAQVAFSDRLGIDRWAAVIGGSMGGMHALEWAIGAPSRVARLAILAAPPVTTADQIGLNSVQMEAVRCDPCFRFGDYYDAADGDGPTRGLALARRMALLNYRSPEELNLRFERGWQSEISPIGAGGRFAVESYLDFHGNKFTRRFDANSYLVLVEAMNSHDVGRGRGGVASALSLITARTVVVGIDSDRLFPVEGQRLIAAHLPGNIDGTDAVVIRSDYGHDGFLIENEAVGAQLSRVLTEPVPPHRG
ncbi:homoserine O-acetyltransferase [Cryobacterium sp. TMT1-21]|uniref:Homoserine O-acetyltransferase n=1 Tax=Cryobacterium shii TaxID=1259235 RepID=A0AAQ2C3W8_9MICO|nr:MULTISPECIES: homoserine O-acetyltransferase [Cryobacterium]TFC42473.1 homoserine O-acetyltransferase [Cryobacterium shii]TFC80805.1 homoserine O-acetyltransferase [Cryobacterium sp. TmT2-59]TFD13267.1 homoserine O-acetyltransferase [Cryobacterium sp. TMT1-21]TFD18688.1 homoserine O-acetyltransferase [Cryobacterium sp. TMT4-10]TFD28490.1 homoserine O-acetyltransferase [Cryobacterium sp. TMT2-23]